jgi:hypothetical protein
MAVYDLSASNPAVPAAGSDRPLVPVWVTANLTTTHLGTADNYILVAKMPDVAYIHNVKESMAVRWSDMDTHATETLDFDIGFADVDGVLDITLLNNGTASENAGQDEIPTAQLATSDPFVDVGGKYISIHIVAKAATAAAGTVQLGFFYSQNVINQSVS